MSVRLAFWRYFSGLVGDHIENYTVPQYGDHPDDQLCDFTKRDIVVSLKRYLNRIDTNARGQTESERDCFKMAHYICELHAIVSGVQREKQTQDTRPQGNTTRQAGPRL